MGVDLTLYALGVSHAERDRAEAKIKELLKPWEYERVLYKDEPQSPSQPLSNPLHEGHFLTFTSESHWGRGDLEEGDLDVLEVRTFLRWPMRGSWPDTYMLVRALQASLPSSHSLYMEPDATCVYEPSPSTLVTDSRLAWFWDKWAEGDVFDNYYIRESYWKRR